MTSPATLATVVTFGILGAFFATAFHAGSRVADVALGDTPTSDVLALAFAAIGAAIGTWVAAPRSLSSRLLAGAAIAVTALALVTRVDAGSWTHTLGAAALVALGWLTTRLAASVAAEFPEGAGARTAAAACVAGAGLAASLLALPAAGALAPARIGLAWCVAAAGVWLPRAARATPRATSNGDAAWARGAVAGFAVAIVVAASRRSFVDVFGNDLPGVSPSDVALGLGVTVGALVAALTARGRRPTARTDAVAACLLGFALLASLNSMDELPDRFAARVASAGEPAVVWRGAAAVVIPRVLPLGLLLGWIVATLLARIPATRDERPRWIEPFLVAGGAGAIAGTLAVDTLVPEWGRVRAVGTAATGVAILAGLATLRARGAHVIDRAIPWLGAVAIAATATLVPAGDPVQRIVDRGLTSPLLGPAGAQQFWLDIDLEDTTETVSILQRGHSRRLFVNGRFEESNENRPKSPGMLAYLPLVTQPDPRRVLLIGIGTGTALESALAFQYAEVHSIVPSAARFDAAARFGPVSANAVAHARHVGHVGDPAAFLRGAEPFDAILAQPSGVWTDESARIASREFLELARSRLTPNGSICFLLSDSSLTKTGFQILLATFADVFPQVEVWGAQGGDVLVLASSSRDPHDPERLLRAYQDPIVRIGFDRSWIATPPVLLSHFLVDDATVRRIAGTAIHTERSGRLAWEEAGRRVREVPIDPVPGLVAIRDDVLARFGNPSEEEVVESVREAIRARDLEREGIERELAADDYGAINAYEEALDLLPPDGSTRRALATLRSRMGAEFVTRLSEQASYQNLREAVVVDSTYAQGFANLGTYLFTTKTWDYAEAVIRKAISIAPNDDLYELLLGRTLKQRGQPANALPHYERAMKLNPRNVETALGYVDTKLTLELPSPDLQYGIDVLEGYLEFEPHNEVLRMRIGRLRDYLVNGLPARVPDDNLASGAADSVPPAEPSETP